MKENGATMLISSNSHRYFGFYGFLIQTALLERLAVSQMGKLGGKSHPS